MYESRPIHWPLSSANKTFVAWVTIHRMNGQTLRVLLADHLMPTLARLDGELADLRAVRDGADKKAARDAERRYGRVARARDELREFIAAVEQCADRGAPPTDGKCPPREQDARYVPDLDDGVMINAAALWPLLDPQWKEPRKWWKELATAKGRKDYDWSHLAMRYWPERVDRKAQRDPSLGVAHGCFWRYHPVRAWTWELRLQDEIGPDFRIEEPPYLPGGRDLGDAGDRVHRDAFLLDHPKAALAAIEREATRRMGRGKGRRTVPEMRILETGLWAGHAADLWELELDLAERQGAEIRILAPDEPEARAAFEAAHPERVDDRKRFLASLVPPVAMFDDEETDEDPLRTSARMRRTTRDDGGSGPGAGDDGARRPGLRGTGSGPALGGAAARHRRLARPGRGLHRVRRAAPGAARRRRPAVPGPRLPGQPPGADAGARRGGRRDGEGAAGHPPAGLHRGDRAGRRRCFELVRGRRAVPQGARHPRHRGGRRAGAPRPDRGVPGAARPDARWRRRLARPRSSTARRAASGHSSGP